LADVAAGKSVLDRGAGGGVQQLKTLQRLCALYILFVSVPHEM
jgi:hypothetical protein